MEDEADHHGAVDPAQAFEDLRAEVSELRRALEALPGAWEESRSPDYTPSLGTIAKGLAAVENRLAGIEKHPALRLTPEQYQQAVAQAGNMLMREAVQKLDRAAQDAERERARLAGLIGSALRQDQQFRALCWTGGIALAAGLILSPLIAGVLPFGLDGRVAALILRDDRWDAGMALMRAGNPDGWRALVDVSNLVRVNQDALAVCRVAAATAKKEQRCVVTVPAQ
jgi:HEAT repeat protein